MNVHQVHSERVGKPHKGDESKVKIKWDSAVKINELYMGRN